MEAKIFSKGLTRTDVNMYVSFLLYHMLVTDLSAPLLCWLFDGLRTMLSVSLEQQGFPDGSDGKESACNAERFSKIPWRRAWQPTPAFLPGESHGQKSLVGYSLWGLKESDMTE